MTRKAIHEFMEGSSLHIIIDDITQEEADTLHTAIENCLQCDSITTDDYPYSEPTDEPWLCPEDMLGTRNLIPEGQYEGFTVSDVYAQNGHYSLAKLLLSIKKMKSMDPRALRTLYEEAIQFTIPLIRRKELDFEDFIAAYKPFLASYVAPGHTAEDWLQNPVEKQDILYDSLIDHITDRMKASIQSARKVQEA